MRQRLANLLKKIPTEVLEVFGLCCACYVVGFFFTAGVLAALKLFFW